MPPNPVHVEAVTALNNPAQALLPRETGEDIGFASPVPLSAEAVQVIMALRNMKDADEDWGRWRDNVFKGRKPINPAELELEGERVTWSNKKGVNAAAVKARKKSIESLRLAVEKEEELAAQATEIPIDAQDTQGAEQAAAEEPYDGSYCRDCYIPLHPDPPPGKLFLFLHALRYRIESVGSFETEVPWWASEKWAGECWERYE